MKIADCPVRVTVEVVGGKWKPLILYSLKERKRRFGELRRLVPEASQKVLTQQLRELERMGIVERRQLDSRIPHVEYGLSNYGRTLRPVLDIMATWGTRHRRNRQ